MCVGSYGGAKEPRMKNQDSQKMRSLGRWLGVRMIAALTLFAVFTLVGCESRKQHPDEKDAVNSALTSANLGVVSVSQDRDKGVMPLTGDVESADKKQQAE